MTWEKTSTGDYGPSHPAEARQQGWTQVFADVADKTEAGFAEKFTEDVVLEASALQRPAEGRDLVKSFWRQPAASTTHWRSRTKPAMARVPTLNGKQPRSMG